MRIETLAIHAGHSVDPSTGAVAAPIHLTTTFQRETDGTYPSGFVYARSDNPNRNALESAIAALEGGTHAAAFASGLAAASAVFQALQPGDHVVAATQTYHGTAKLLREVFQPWGLEITFVDMTDLDAIRAAVRPATKILYAETPSNPLMKITDLAQVAQIAHDAGALCVCDNTFAPLLQRPLELGVDFVIYSATKYLGGHSDVTGGLVVAREDSAHFQRLRQLQSSAGAILAPFDSWLVLRGLRTLPCRMRVHSDNAARVAEFLAGHPQVEAVHYPGLATHSGHTLAARQMRSFGGMLSIEVKGGREAALAVSHKVRYFIRATSLGGVESLIEHRASIAGEDPEHPPGAPPPLHRPRAPRRPHRRPGASLGLARPSSRAGAARPRDLSEV